MVISRFEVYLVDLEPTVGHELRKSRPCLVVSPDAMNHRIQTFIVAPMSTALRTSVTRIPCLFRGKAGQIVLDQLRTVDAARVIRRLGKIDPQTSSRVLAILRDMFAE